MELPKSKYELIFLLCILIERLGGGILSGLPSLCLLDFANIFDLPVDKVAIILSAKSAGSMIGSLIAPLYLQFEPYKDKISTMTLFGILMILSGVLTALSPLMPNLTLLFILIAASTVIYGFLDLALQSVIIQTWGREASKSYVHFYHMAWSIGSILGPYVTLPFVIDEEDSIDDLCDISSGDEPLNLTGTTKIYGSFGEEKNESNMIKIFWPWLITAGFWCLGGVIAIYVGLKNYTKKIS